MYAIIESGGKQYKISPGDILNVEKLAGEPGQAITLDKVLLVSKDGEVKIGRPYLPKVKVLAKVVELGKGPKVVSFKFRHKTGYHRTRGHRQLFTRLKIEEIKEG